MGTKAHSEIGMDTETVVRLLNKAYADEWLAFLQYWTAAKVVRGMMRIPVSQELEAHAMDEFRHAGMIAKRIIQLDGVPLLGPDDILKEANCAYLRPGDPCCCRIVEQSIDGERCAIGVYRRMMEATHGKDQITYHLAVELLKDELDHEQDFQNFKEDMALIEKRLRPSSEK